MRALKRDVNFTLRSPFSPKLSDNLAQFSRRIFSWPPGGLQWSGKFSWHSGDPMNAGVEWLSSWWAIPIKYNVWMRWIFEQRQSIVSLGKKSLPLSNEFLVNRVKRILKTSSTTICYHLNSTTFWNNIRKQQVQRHKNIWVNISVAYIMYSITMTFDRP